MMHVVNLSLPRPKEVMLVWLRLATLALVLLAVSVASAKDLVHFPGDNSFLPESWLESPIEAETEPLDESLIADAKEIIERGIAKYPPEIIKEFLNGVYIVGSLRFYDVGYGGTYMANAERVVLVYRASFDPKGFEQRFHHEFSSILLKKNENRFDEERWRNGNESGFVYRAPGVIEEQSGDRSEATKVLEAEQKKTGGSGSSLLALNEELMKEGFLTNYNRVSIEQDLNELAAHLFTNIELWRFCRDHPRIDHKVDVLIEFYRDLHPDFDRLYFRELTMPAAEKPKAP